MKKVGTLVLALTLCFCTACGSADAQETKEPEVVEAVEQSVEAAVGEELGTEETEPTEIIVYSQISGYEGEQQGWFAQVMLEKFNVKLKLSTRVEFEEGLKQGFLGDIIVFGTSGKYYQNAVEEGLLLDWEASDLLTEHGQYILEHMKPALEYNRSRTPEVGKIFGFGNSVATDKDTFSSLLYSWDIRWDLYEQLGYPQVKDLEEFTALLEDMKELCPVDDNGEETYAMAIWPDWDDGMMFSAGYLAGAYYGYDAFHLGFYDARTGAYYGALEENGPYLEMLQFLNTLYQKGLLDPDATTQTYEATLQKLENSGYFFSPVEYAGSLSYNTPEHITQNKYMAPLVPGEATPAVFGMSKIGGNRIWSIGANSEHKELCMELINWFCTPEGVLTGIYGPKGVCWDYDAEGNTYFTELGKSCYEDRVTIMPGEYGASYFGDGCPQINNTTWSYNAKNPDSNGETYNAEHWKSNSLPPACPMEQDWQEYTGASTALEYMQGVGCVVIPEVFYAEEEKSESLKKVWEQVGDCIESLSWQAVYAQSKEEYDNIVAQMLADAKACGYELCLQYGERQAARRFAEEEKISALMQ